MNTMRRYYDLKVDAGENAKMPICLGRSNVVTETVVVWVYS